MEVEITLRIVGTRPLIQNNPASMQPTGTTKRRGDVPAPNVEAKSKEYRLPSGQLYIKSEAFHGSFMKAASGFKVGKFTAKPILAAALTYSEELCGLIHPKTGEPITVYVVDTRRAVVQGQGVLRSRPRIDEWATLLRVKYDDELLEQKHVLKFAEEAGKRVGVGDQRPGAPKTPGPFGKYAATLENGG